VGIEDYTYLPDVVGAAANAKDWKRWLEETRGVDAVKLLTDAEATRNTIMAAVEAASQLVGDEGTLWFVFIGHGAPSAGKDDGVLVGVTAQQRVLDFYPNTIANTELTETLERGKQAHTVVVLDACFAGRTEEGDSLLPDQLPALLSGTWQPSQTTVLAAAEEDQFAGLLPGSKRPAFSYLVLGALRGWGDRDGDRSVTAQEAVEYARRTLFEVANDRTQTPALLGPGGDLALSRPTLPEAGPDLSLFAEAARSAVVRDMSVGEKVAEIRRQQEALQSAADEDWLEPIAASREGGAEGRSALQMFVDTYEGATVTVAGESHPVSIAQVGRAKDVLADYEGYWRKRRQRAAGAALLSGGVAAVATGTAVAGVFYEIRESEVQEGLHGSARHDSAHRSMTAGFIVLGTGAAATAVGIINLALGRKIKAPVAVAPGPITTVSVVWP